MDNIYKIAADNPFGPVTAPPAIDAIGGAEGIPNLIGVIIRFFVLGAGIYAVINFVLAGYMYISSAGNPQGIQAATAKIWHSALGVAVAGGALLIAALVGQILFKDPTALLEFKIFTIQ